MVREVVRDPMFLQRKSVEANMSDMMIAVDLLDTLKANFEGLCRYGRKYDWRFKKNYCNKRYGKYILMFNPEIVKAYGEYETEEGCLSLDGERKTKRYKTVTVKYVNDKFKTVTRTFTNFTAQIIQHEIDHCNGILI